MARISVVIPVYNRARFIGEAIDSILTQTVSDLELILIDDGSTDGSRAVIAGYDDPRLRLLENPRNLGIAASRNRGIAEAVAPYVAFLDSDDRALPTRLEKQIAFLERHPGHAAVGSWIRWIDAAGTRRGAIKRKAADADQIAAERLFRSGLENSTATARTEILRAYPHREDFRLGSDYELWARINADYPLAALREVLVERRQHGEQASDERSPEVVQWRLAIFAAQLDRLDVRYDPRDLERHYALRRMHKEGFSPGSDFLDWAENWLDRLRHANAEHGLYPEPAFSRVLGLFWAKSCWFAVFEIGPRALWRCLASPLRRTVAPGVRAELVTRLRLGAR